MEDDQTHQIRFRANPTQKGFITSRSEADLFAARMGEGKSAALAWACWYHTRLNPGAQWAFIRDTWENLRDTTQKEFFYWFPPGICGEYHASAKTYRWRLEEMRGEIQWLGMDDPKDASKLQSRALSAFAMDEPAPAAYSGGISEFIFTTAMSRLRVPNMKWYASKLAENNPDESHWTFSRFVKPGTDGYACWQTRDPENLDNLPDDYYEKLRKNYADRPDLVDRFVDGKFGFQRLGKSVTPSWKDEIHLAKRLEPLEGVMLHILWDFGLNPTATITQITPTGHWNFLECLVGDDVGLFEHIEQTVKPRLQERFDGLQWDHTVDPAGRQREQSSSERSALKVLREELGGSIYPGVVDPREGIDALNAALSQIRDGVGMIQVDKRYAAPIWFALRGGWHYKVSGAGIISDKAVKNVHSHPGDTARYGAARYFPLGRLRKRTTIKRAERMPRYFHFPRPVGRLPKEAETIGEDAEA